MIKESVLPTSIYQKTFELFNSKLVDIIKGQENPFDSGYNVSLDSVMKIANSIEEAKKPFIAMGDNETIQLMDKTERLLKNTPGLLLTIVGDLMDHLDDKTKARQIE